MLIIYRGVDIEEKFLDQNIFLPNHDTVLQRTRTTIFYQIFFSHNQFPCGTNPL